MTAEDQQITLDINPKNLEQLAKIEGQHIQKQQEQGLLTWEDITIEAFPAYAKLNPVRLFTLKLVLIKDELESLLQLGFLVQGSDEAVGILKSRIIQLQKSASDSIIHMYPDIQPQKDGLSQNTKFTRDDAAFISWVKDQVTAYQLYTPDVIPSLSSLTPDQILLGQLQILQSYWEQWNDLRKSELTVSTIELLGFNTDNLDDNTHPIDEVIDKIKRNILEIMFNLTIDYR